MGETPLRQRAKCRHIFKAGRMRNAVLSHTQYLPTAATTVPLVTWGHHSAKGRPERKETRIES